MSFKSAVKSQRKTLEKRLIGRVGGAMETASWASCRRVGSWMGLAFFHGSRRRRDIAIANLRLALPHLSQRQAQQIARRSAQNFGMSFCELLHLRTASAGEIEEYAQWDGLENVMSALSQGRGVVLTTAHFGAWEVMGARMAQEFPLTVVVRLTSNQALREHITQVRNAIDVKMIMKSDTARAALNVLHDNGALAIFPDQHAGPTGLLMPMFAQPTRMFDSPARFALTTGAPIVPIFGIRRTPWFKDGRVIVRAMPAMHLKREDYASRDEAVLAGTRFVVQQTENVVRAHPDQWLWMHKRWRPEDRADAQAMSAATSLWEHDISNGAPS